MRFNNEAGGLIYILMSFKDVGYFDPEQPIASKSGNLPHWRQSHVTYFVTFRLTDSIPLETLDLWKRERIEWIARHPEPRSDLQKREYHELFVVRFHDWLDAGHGKCVLAKPKIREIVANAISYFADQRYFLREWVVMPNHTHAVVTPIADYDLSKILHSWKSFTANEINKMLKTSGELWQRESFDHIVRSPEHLTRIEKYIHDNPKNLKPDTFTIGCIHSK